VKLPDPETFDSLYPNGTFVDVGDLLSLLYFSNSKQYFIRPCYYKMLSKLSFGQQGKERAIITGTPGTGKSMFLLLILIHLVQQNISVCYHNLQTRTSFYFDKSGSFEIGEKNIFWDNAVVLLDNPDEIPKGYPTTWGMYILAASPKHQNYYEFAKPASNYNKFNYIVMPLWSLDELLYFNSNSTIKLDESVIRERYSLVGGVCRVVRALNIEYYKSVTHQLKSALADPKIA